MLVVALYQKYRDAKKFIGRLMVAVVVLHVAFEFGIEALNLTALMIAKGKFLASLEPIQRQEWVYLFLRTARVSNMGFPMGFRGMWLVLFGTFVYLSGRVLKVLGFLLMARGLAYPVQSTFLFDFPEPANRSNPFSSFYLEWGLFRLCFGF